MCRWCPPTPHRAEFREALLVAVAFAEAQAPQVMVDVFFDEENGTVTSFQLYRDSEAVLRHWELSDPYIAEVMKHCKAVRLEVFGSPSDEVRAGLGNASGTDVTVHPRLTGYLKAEGSASGADQA